MFPPNFCVDDSAWTIAFESLIRIPEAKLKRRGSRRIATPVMMGRRDLAGAAL